MANGLLGLSDGVNNSMVLMGYNDTWRNIRKIMHQLLTAKQAEAYRPFQDAESKQLLWDYLHQPDKYYLHNGRYANSVIMSVVFGKRTVSEDPKVIQLFETIEFFLGNTTPGKWLVDSFPQLTKLPKSLQWWRPYGERGYRQTIEYGLWPIDLTIVSTTSSFKNLKNPSKMVPQRNASLLNSIPLSKNMTLYLTVRFLNLF